MPSESTASKPSELGVSPNISNGAKRVLQAGVPYQVTVKIRGTADLLFHAWNVESVQGKADAAKGSKAKKSDDVESYIYRNTDGIICLPGMYLRGAIVGAAKFRQDPRSPRKSAMDLYKAGIVSLTDLAPIGPKPSKEWGFLHKARVQVQRNGITRTRPAFHAGWEAEVTLACLVPEYIRPDDLHETIIQAGRLIGVADFRPTYGRFQVVQFDIDF